MSGTFRQIAYARFGFGSSFPNFRPPQDIEHGPWQKQMKGAKLALEELGFSI